MSSIEYIGRASAAPMFSSRAPTKQLSDGTDSHSYLIVSSRKRLYKGARPIEVKRELPHEYRNSSNTVLYRYTCDWCSAGYDAPIHHF